jgi:hypothetical protein
MWPPFFLLRTFVVISVSVICEGTTGQRSLCRPESLRTGIGKRLWALANKPPEISRLVGAGLVNSTSALVSLGRRQTMRHLR